jgi:NADH:ubiquinone oxidoreductase subunit E
LPSKIKRQPKPGKDPAVSVAERIAHPDITDEMWERIDALILRWRATPGAVIGVLRECQEIVGYLPVPLIDHISRGLNLPLSDVYGVASFYALFSMQPKGRHTIKVCLGTACYVKGIKEVLSRIGSAYHLQEGGCTDDRRFSLEAVRCLGACGLAPVMVVGGDVHGAITADKVLSVLDRYQ